MYLRYKTQQAIQDQKYKTELCKSFITDGSCKYGMRCRFAHGLQDLLSKKRPIKSSAECPSFATIGFCQFGENCDLTHPNVIREENYDEDKVLEREIKSYLKCHLAISNKRLNVFREIIEDNFNSSMSTDSSKGLSEDEFRSDNKDE
jgi:hypothetical protein